MSYFVTGLYVYPVKSCAGTSLSEAQIDARGIKHDRQWMLVDKNGQCLTQRDLPRMSLIKPEVTTDGGLLLNAPQMPEIDVPVVTNNALIEVTVWEDTCKANDQGDTIAQWLSQFLAVKCRLVRMSDQFTRLVDKNYAKRGDDQVGFADGYPFLLVSYASLVDLNQRLPERLPMNRFRPSIVVDGCGPFQEDTWSKLEIGQLTFDVVKPCARCVIPTINQETATNSTEPLKTLAAYRRIDGKILFGQNLIHSGPGKILVGDLVRVLTNKCA